MDMAEAADELGQLDLAVWLLEQARQKSQTLPALNRALARLYEKRGNFTQAIALWNLVRKARPADKEADRKLKDLAVNETIARGNYEGAVADAAPCPSRAASRPPSRPVPRNTAWPGPRRPTAATPTRRRRRPTAPAARPPRSAPASRPTSPTPTCTCNWRPSTAATATWNRPAPSCRRGWGRPATPSS